MLGCLFGVVLLIIIYGALGFLLQAILAFFGVLVPLWVAVGILIIFGVITSGGGGRH